VFTRDLAEETRFGETRKQLLAALYDNDRADTGDDNARPAPDQPNQTWRFRGRRR